MNWPKPGNSDFPLRVKPDRHFRAPPLVHRFKVTFLMFGDRLK